MSRIGKDVDLTFPKSSRQKSKPIQLIGVKSPIILHGTDLEKSLIEWTKAQKVSLQNKDIIVISSKIVSISRGLTVNLDTVTPSKQAIEISRKTGKDPRFVELVLQNSSHILSTKQGKLIVRTKFGLICSNAGIDKSNVPGKDTVVILPKNPNKEAFLIRKKLKELTEKNVAVVITDTHGRELRHGDINIAIGVSGIKAIKDLRGAQDIFGRTLHMKHIAIADEIAGASELMSGSATERTPIVILRGYKYPVKLRDGKELIRSPEKIFRIPPKSKWIEVKLK